MGYKLKEKTSDFRVTELIDLKLDDSGPYAYFWLVKEDYTTVKALQKLADFVRVRVRDIGFAGNKDRQAITRQAISVKDPQGRIKYDAFERFADPGIKLEYIGRGREPITLGSLSGNRFGIILRECSHAPNPISSFVNYFDEQRFSSGNEEVGRALVKGKMKEAASLVHHIEVEQHLKELPNDHVGAMKRLPLKTMLIYIHAYQSWLWNETVKRYIEKKYESVLRVDYRLGKLLFPEPEVHDSDLRVPIVGFGSEIGSDEIDKIVREVMKTQGVTERDFIIRSMPHLSAEGGSRRIFASVSGLKIEKIGDDSYHLVFSLPKGCYATMAIRRMMTENSQ